MSETSFPPRILISDNNIPLILRLTEAAVMERIPNTPTTRMEKYLELITPAFKALANNGQIDPDQAWAIVTFEYFKYAAVNMFQELRQRRLSVGEMQTRILANSIPGNAAARKDAAEIQTAEQPPATPSPPSALRHPSLFKRILGRT